MRFHSIAQTLAAGALVFATAFAASGCGKEEDMEQLEENPDVRQRGMEKKVEQVREYQK